MPEEAVMIIRGLRDTVYVPEPYKNVCRNLLYERGAQTLDKFLIKSKVND